MKDPVFLLIKFLIKLIQETQNLVILSNDFS